MSTYRELLNWGQEILELAKVPDASVDAWELMEFVFAMEKSCYFLCRDDKIEDESRRKRYRELIRQRAARVPLQQITGRAWFMGYEFLVDHHVLVPRFDTECLVEEAERLLRPGMRILDMCTGSGCILLSLLGRNPGVQGVGADISPEALRLAGKNREKLKLKAELICSDLFERVEGRFDMIISNPPYIPSGEIEGLMPEVRDHEPRTALDGHEDGLYFYRKIVEQAGNYLNPGGWLAFEIGSSQGNDLRRMLKAAGFEQVRVGKDLAGLDRTAWGQYFPEETRGVDKDECRRNKDV